MANLTKQEFIPLSVSRDNYMSLARDVKMHLASMGLEEILVPKKKPSSQEKAKVMIFLCHHIDEALKL